MERVKNQDGTTGRPAFIALGHELLHVRTMNKAKLDQRVPNNSKDPVTNRENALTIDEINTRKEENKLRRENGVVKRAEVIKTE